MVTIGRFLPIRSRASMAVALRTAMLIGVAGIVSCTTEPVKEKKMAAQSDAANASRNATDTGGDGAGDDTVGGSGGGGSASGPAAPANYVPQNGDKLRLTTRTKAWNGAEQEPGEWQANTSAVELVAGLFPEGGSGSCNYLVQRTAGSAKSWMLRGCSAAPLSCSVAARTTCSESDLGLRDFGDAFKSAKGVQKSCVTLSDGADGATVVTKTVGQVFTHPQVLVPDRVIYRLDKSCTMAVAAGGNVASADPCRADEATASRSLTEFRLEEQLRGTKRTMAPAAVVAAFSGTGFPAAGEISRSAPSCSMVGGRLSVVVPFNHCRSGAIQQSSVTISDVPLTASLGSALPAGGVSIDLAGVSSTSALGDCSVDVEPVPSAGMVKGAVSCSEPFAAAAGQSPVHLQQFKWSCLAPEQMGEAAEALNALAAQYDRPFGAANDTVAPATTLPGATTTTPAGNGGNNTTTTLAGGVTTTTQPGSAGTTTTTMPQPCTETTMTLTVDPAARTREATIPCNGSLGFFNADDDTMATITRGGVTHVVYVCNDISAADLMAFNLVAGQLRSCRSVPQLEERGFLCNPSDDSVVAVTLTRIASCLGLRTARVPVRRDDVLRLYSVGNNSRPITATFRAAAP